jgi:threonine/homoserine/homoserine lactone efflux protein
MSPWLPEPALLAAFVLASLVLAVTPGPAVLYIIARSLSQGRRSGLASVAGVALGNLGNAVGAALGLAALFAVSATSFTVIKWAGALYLVWLGVQALRRPDVDGAQSVRPPAQALGRVFRDGFFVALLNPKTALFFAAFLPQFISPAGPAAQQSIALGVMFVVVAASTDVCYAISAGVLAPRLSKVRGAGRVGRYLSATVYIGLGVYTALSGSRPKA